MNATTSTSPVEVFGGVVIPNEGSYNGTSSSGTSTSVSTASASKSAPVKGTGFASRSVSRIFILGAILLAIIRLIF
jgi:hypothetical protein